MHKEIERKFLVKNQKWKNSDEGTRYRQGYLSSGDGYVVRIRIEGNQARLTIKAGSVGLSRMEYQYPVPLDEARDLLKLCGNRVVEKTRYKVNYGGMLWEIDVFEGKNKGLVLAEVELESENQKIDLPPWIGGEVSCDPEYYNAALAENPRPVRKDR